MPLESPRGLNAAIARARTLVGDLGRFAEAESVLDRVVAEAGPRAVDHRYLLTQLFYWEGRLDEMRRLVQEGWSASPNRAGNLRSLWQIDSAVMMVDLVQNSVEQAARRRRLMTASGWRAPTSLCCGAVMRTRAGGWTRAWSVGPTTPQSGAPGSGGRAPSIPLTRRAALSRTCLPKGSRAPRCFHFARGSPRVPAAPPRSASRLSS